MSASRDRPTLGWYLHHHGTGHLNRFLAVRPWLDCEVVVFSSLDEPASLPDATTWVTLGRDDHTSDRFESPTAEGLLHWAPLSNHGYTNRMFTLSQQIHKHRCRGFVVDVSVEVTLASRLLGLPTVVFTQPGSRTDLPHQLAYRAAEAIIAAWAEPTEHSAGLVPWQHKVHYVGGISRFEGRARTANPTAGRILVLGGGGGAGVSTDDVQLSAALTPDTTWRAVGVQSGKAHLTDAASPITDRSAMQINNWVLDPWPDLCAAEVVISWAGQNAVADLAAADAKVIVIPQPRPFDEQAATARALAAQGLALALPHWPKAQSWTTSIESARALTPRWSRWQVSGAAQRAAVVIWDSLS